MTKRVAIVYHFFANYRKPILNELSRNQKFEFTFVADAVNRLMPEVETWKPQEPIQQARCFPIGGGFMIQTGLLKVAWKRDTDCIVFLGDWKWPMTWLGALLARFRGKRVLFWTHGWRTRDIGIKRAIRKLFYRLPHGLLLYGNRARNIAIEMGFPPDSLYVVFNSLDYDTHANWRKHYDEAHSSAIRKQLFEDDKTPVVICSARLNKRKRLDELIVAISELKKQSHPVNLILIGDGSEKVQLAKLAEQHEVKIHFEGKCFDEKRIADLTMAANVTVSPGPIGLTAIQSLTYGVPAITNDEFSTQGPEFEAIEPGVSGDFFPNSNLQELAYQIKKWTSTQFIAPHIRANCSSIVDRFYNPQFQATVFESAISSTPATEHEIGDKQNFHS